MLKPQKTLSGEKALMAMDSASEGEMNEEKAGAAWEDWTEDGSVVNGAANVDSDGETQVKCLLCSSTRPSSYLVLQHCSEEHKFDVLSLLREAELDFYDCLRLLNFIRSEVADKRCWNCGVQCDSDRSLLEHLNAVKHFSLPASGVWKEDKYLTPFLESDPLLYEFEEDRDEEPEEYAVVDKNEIISELAGVALTSDGDTLKDLVEEMKLAPDSDTTTKGAVSEDEEHNPSSTISNDAVKKAGKVNFGKVAEKEILRVNHSYFSSYGEYGIHREMLGDKVRTEAYQKALMNNPSLLKDATVLDIGCGTGILSLFAAKAGASRVVAVDGSQKMVSVARQVAKDNGYLADDDGNKGIKVVGGMIEDLDTKLPLEPHTADVIVSEWMGYCLLYESMLGSVLHARDRWLRPGGAMLPDIAEMHMAGFGRGGTSLAFWDDVYGFSMKHIADELVHRAAEYPIIDVIDKKDIITEPCMIKTFDLVTMKPDDVDFNSTFELRPNFSGSTNWCYGVVIWFDTAFTSRFCRDEPVLLSTSPFSTSTHWAQTILTFKEPVALCKDDKNGSGVDVFPAAFLKGRVSIARTYKHRSIDVSIETTAVASNGATRVLPVQIFDI